MCSDESVFYVKIGTHIQKVETAFLLSVFATQMDGHCLILKCLHSHLSSYPNSHLRIIYKIEFNNLLTPIYSKIESSYIVPTRFSYCCSQSVVIK